MKTLVVVGLLLTRSPLLAQQAADRFVGTWRLETVEVSTDGELWAADSSTRYGQDPMGILMYDASGNMAVQLMRRNRPDLGAPGGRVSAEDLANADPELKSEALQGFGAYWGTYTVFDERRVVIHQREGHNIPDQEATPAERGFEFRGDLLMLHSPPRRYVWRRIGG